MWKVKIMTDKIINSCQNFLTSTEIYDRVKKILENKAQKREILTHGA